MSFEFSYNLNNCVAPLKNGAQKPGTQRDLDAASNMLLDPGFRREDVTFYL